MGRTDSINSPTRKNKRHNSFGSPLSDNKSLSSLFRRKSSSKHSQAVDKKNINAYSEGCIVATPFAQTDISHLSSESIAREEYEKQRYRNK
eukprot:Pgem_evm1s18336